MKIKLFAADLNRMLRVVQKCMDPRHPVYCNIEIRTTENQVLFRSTNGQVFCEMSAPVLCGESESVCVDGSKFVSVVAQCSGEVEIFSDGTVCRVSGNGRTVLPAVVAAIPETLKVSGEAIRMNGTDLMRCEGAVSYAVSADETRMILTGILTEASGGNLTMVALDGFQLSMESIPCGDGVMKAVIPAGLFKIARAGIAAGDDVTIRCDDKRVELRTEDMLLTGALLAGEYIDYRKIIPTEHKTVAVVDTMRLCDAMKGAQVAAGKKNMVRFEVSAGVVKVSSNSEEAQFEAEVPAEVSGDGIAIAFNHAYMENALKTVPTDKAVLRFCGSVSPCLVSGVGDDGVHIVLPVRVHAA